MGNQLPTQGYLQLIDENGNASKVEATTIELHPTASKLDVIEVPDYKFEAHFNIGDKNYYKMKQVKSKRLKKKYYKKTISYKLSQLGNNNLNHRRK